VFPAVAAADYLAGYIGSADDSTSHSKFSDMIIELSDRI